MCKSLESVAGRKWYISVVGEAYMLVISMHTIRWNLQYLLDVWKTLKLASRVSMWVELGSYGGMSLFERWHSFGEGSW